MNCPSCGKALLYDAKPRQGRMFSCADCFRRAFNRMIALVEEVGGYWV